MGSIPKYRNGQIARTSQFVDIEAPLKEAQSRNQIANSVGSVAKTVGDVNFKLKEIEYNKNSKLDEHKLAEKTLDKQRYFSETLKKYEASYKENPNMDLSKMIEEYRKDTNNYDEEVFKELKTQEAKDRYKLIAKKSLALDEESLFSWKAKKEEETLISKNQEIAKNLSDLSIENSTLNGAKGALLNLEQLRLSSEPALGEINAKNQFEKLKQDVAYDYGVSALVNGDFSELKKMLKDDEVKTALGVDKINSLKKNLKLAEERQVKRKEALFKKLEKDPWGKWDYLGGKSTPLDPLAFSPATDPKGELITKTLNQRELTIAQAKEKGIELPFFRKKEVEKIINAFEKTRPENIGVFLSHLDKYTTQEQKFKLSEQLFFEHNQPALAGSFSIAEEALNESVLIIEGQNLLGKNKKEGVLGKSFISTPSDSEVIKEFDAYIGNMLPSKNSRSIALESAFSHYVGKIFRKGKITNELDVDEFRESINAVIGEPIEINDSVIPSFRVKMEDGRYEFLEEDDFRTILRIVSEEDLLKTQGAFPATIEGEEINLDKSQNRLNFKVSKEGSYYLFRDSDIVVNSETKKPYILDLKKYVESNSGKIKKYKEQRERALSLGRSGIKM